MRRRPTSRAGPAPRTPSPRPPRVRRLADRPRVLRHVSEPHLRVDLFDRVPLGCSPSSTTRVNSRSRAPPPTLDVPMLFFTSASSYTLEAVADEPRGAPKWFQLYWSADPAIASSFVERAENAGYDGIVVTLDTLLLGAGASATSNRANCPSSTAEGVANGPRMLSHLARPGTRIQRGRGRHPSTSSTSSATRR